ncbi:MAG TPA: hypothetical protein VF962_11030 [Gemmatimonadaceae bacterium]
MADHVISRPHFHDQWSASCRLKGCGAEATVKFVVDPSGQSQLALHSRYRIAPEEDSIASLTSR